MDTCLGPRLMPEACLRHDAGMTTLYRLCGLKEALDESRVLLAGARLDARGDVDDGGPGGADGLGHVVGVEAARQDEGHVLLDAGEHAPIEGRAVPAGAGC